MNKIIIIFSFFLLSLSTFSSHWTIKGKSPYELKVLVESFNMAFLTEEEKVNLEKQLKELDALLGSLEEKDRFFVAKSSVYKWVLQSAPFAEVPTDFQLNDFKTADSLKDLSPFAKWLLLSIKSDVASLVTLPDYQAYLKERKDRGRTIRYKAVERRVNLIRPWAYLYSNSSGVQISLRLMKYQFILLKNLISQYKLFHRFQNKELPNPKTKLSFFSLDDGKPKNEDRKQDKVLSELDQIIEKHKNKNLPLPVNDWKVARGDRWMPKEEPTLDEKAEININNPRPNPSYVAPKNLPQPVDDWNE